MNKLKEIQIELQHKSTPEAKAAFQKFVPGTTKLYGVRTPDIDVLAKKYKAEGFSLVQELWRAGAFEEQILAAKILQKIAKKDAGQSVKLAEKFSKDITNWAVCDAMGMQALQTIRDTHKEEIFKLATSLHKSSNLWQRRLSLVLVEYYTRFKTDHPAIMKLVTALEKDEDYYVKKAIAWIKRNMKKGK